MKLLEERILKDGIAVDSDILRVDSFLNHQVDPVLMEQIGNELAEHFKDHGVTKVLTIESSGIAPAMMCAKAMELPLIILKKQTSKTLCEDIYKTVVASYTKSTSYDLTLSKHYINENDHVLIVDDFLANGEAATGAVRLARMGGATVAGIGIVIEKAFQPGRGKLEEQGFEVYSLARICKMDKNYIEFCD